MGVTWFVGSRRHRVGTFFASASEKLPYTRDEIATALDGLGALLEWSSTNLLAVDAHDAGHAREVADYLQEQEDAGRLMYETGKTA